MALRDRMNSSATASRPSRGIRSKVPVIKFALTAGSTWRIVGLGPKIMSSGKFIVKPSFGSRVGFRLNLHVSRNECDTTAMSGTGEPSASSMGLGSGYGSRKTPWREKKCTGAMNVDEVFAVYLDVLKEKGIPLAYIDGDSVECPECGLRFKVELPPADSEVVNDAIDA